MALEGKVTPQFFGPYQVHELIGRGGMGEVHRAYDGVRKRTVALKRLRPEFSADERFRARFLRECQRVAPLTEAHVIPIHDYGEFDGRLFLDMRLIEGDNLAHRLATQGPLPSHLAVGIIVQVGAALDAAHAAGLVHRDVKPSNVLVSDDGLVPHCYLADFGVAGAVGGSGGSSLTLTGTTVGTVDYIAPERLLGSRIDRRADVYSLGCLLFEALTGRPPFRADELPAMIHAHLNREPPRASELVPGVPRSLDAVIARGMAKDPDARYGSAGELAAAAQAALREEPAVGVASAAPVTQPAEPTPQGAGALTEAPARPPRKRSRLAPRLLVCGVLLLAFGLVAGGLTLFGRGGTAVVRAEAADVPGKNPFTPDAGKTEFGRPAMPTVDGAVSGNTPGLYGGTQTDDCDPDMIASFLGAHPDRAAAWASAQGIRPGDIRPFLHSLTALTLRTDTAVTNHGFRDGQATPFQSILQAGTTVLVDGQGAPRVRCACGNPLGAPDPVTRYEGSPPWPGFSSRNVTVIRPAPSLINEFVVVQPDSGTVVARPRATRGDQDHPAAPADVEVARSGSIGAGVTSTSDGASTSDDTTTSASNSPGADIPSPENPSPGGDSQSPESRSPEIPSPGGDSQSPESRSPEVPSPENSSPDNPSPGGDSQSPESLSPQIPSPEIPSPDSPLSETPPSTVEGDQP